MTPLVHAVRYDAGRWPGEHVPTTNTVCGAAIAELAPFGRVTCLPCRQLASLSGVLM